MHMNIEWLASFSIFTIKLSETSLPGVTIVWLLHTYLSIILSFYDLQSCSVSVIYRISEWHEMGKT